MTTTYLARHGEVRVASDEGSRLVSITVAGKEATLTAETASQIAKKLREAARRSS